MPIPFLPQGTLIFDTYKNAEAYRTMLVQTMRLSPPVPTILTLDDGCRIAASGEIAGSSFRVPALEQAIFHFASTPKDQNPDIHQDRQLQESVAGLVQCIEKLQEQDKVQQAPIRKLHRLPYR